MTESLSGLATPFFGAFLGLLRRLSIKGVGFCCDVLKRLGLRQSWFCLFVKRNKETKEQSK